MLLTLRSSEIQFFWGSGFKKSDSDTVIDFDLLPQWGKQSEWFLHYLHRLCNSFLDWFHHKGPIPWLQWKAGLPGAHGTRVAGWLSPSYRTPHQQRAGLLVQVPAIGTTRDNYKKVSPCLRNLNTSHIGWWHSLGLSKKKKKQHLSHCHTFITTCIPGTPPINTLDKFRQVQLNHLRWAKRSGPWNLVRLII